MKYLIVLMAIAISFLAGCTAPPVDVKPKVVVEYKYVTKAIPRELLEVPANVPAIDVSTATDKDIAFWLLEKEERTVEIESKLTKIKSFYEEDTK